MKDVVACEKSRGGGKQPLIREYPNGVTRPAGRAVTSLPELNRVIEDDLAK